MALVACGLNHKSAPIGLRERFALTPPDQAPLLRDLLASGPVREASVLSTCNRTEIYCDSDDTEFLLPWLADRKAVGSDELSAYAYTHTDDNAIRHLMRVASGLDSMMLGEPQILGQLKNAYREACDLGAVGHNLRAVFHHVFTASKRVRTHTNISNNPVSVAFTAVHLLKNRFSDLAERQVMLIGAGDTTQLVAKYLADEGVQRFLIANRTVETAEQLAQQVGGDTLTIGDIPHFLAQTDIVISATACPLPFISKNLVQRTLEQRQHRAMCLIDLAIPRDIEAEVADIDGADLYNIDDLQAVVARNFAERQVAAAHAEKIIDDELVQFTRWQQGLNAKDAICHYRERSQQLAEMELYRALNALENGQDAAELMHELKHRLLQKLVHQPTVRLHQAAQSGDDHLLKLAHHLYSE